MNLLRKLIATGFLLTSISGFAATTNNFIPLFKGGLLPEAIFPQGRAAINHCFVAGNHDVPQCLLQYYQRHGASSQAIAFLQLTGGYIEKMATYGKITVILAHVMAADHSQQIFIVNTEGDFFDAEYLSKGIADSLDRQFNKNTQYQALVKSNPLIFYLNDDLTPQVEQDKNGSISVLFSYRITECMACAKKAFAKVAFNFDRKGKFKNIKLDSVTKVPNLR